jgi:hypothetical protein
MILLSSLMCSFSTHMYITCNHFLGYIISNGNNFLKLFPRGPGINCSSNLGGYCHNG